MTSDEETIARVAFALGQAQAKAGYYQDGPFESPAEDALARFIMTYGKIGDRVPESALRWTNTTNAK